METAKHESTGKANDSFDSRFKKKKSFTKQAYDEKVLQLKRVTKVVKGGKKMTFRAVVVVGDKRSLVGVGIGRADDINIAIEKAVLNGKKNLIQVPLTRQHSIPHVIQLSTGACSLLLRPAAKGSGVIAGGSIKTVLELAGIKNILAKQLGTQNILNNAKATIKALVTLNEKIEREKSRTITKKLFYEKIMKKQLSPLSTY